MRHRAIPFALVLLILGAAWAGERERVAAETGPPVLDTSGFTPLRLWSRAAYEDESLGYPLAVAPGHDPAIEDESARYGTIGGEAATIVTFVVRVEEDGSRVVLVDQNRNGDLTDDPPHPFERTDGGILARFDLRGPHVPLALFFPDNAPEWARERVFLMTDSTREGVLSLGDASVRFSVHGSLGVYGGDYNRVTFDTNGDGALDSARDSDESYVPLHDEYVNLAGRSWTFEVAPDGGRLTLNALDAMRPDRPSLAEGKPAPDFEYVDASGSAGRLSDHRGRLVLLYFWSTHCVPCLRETPDLLAAYSRFHALGLDVLAVAKDDRLLDVLGYVEEQAIPWPQVVEDERGPIVRLYRVSPTPTSILVDRDGTIVSRSSRLETAVDRIAARVPSDAVSLPD